VPLCRQSCVGRWGEAGRVCEGSERQMKELLKNSGSATLQGGTGGARQAKAACGCAAELQTERLAAPG
jgi:hypothetical protein